MSCCPRDAVAALPRSVWNSSASGGLNARCLAAFAGEAWRCYFPQYSAPFIATPLFISGSSVDMWGLENILALDCVPTSKPVAGLPPCDGAQLAAMAGWWASFRASILPLLAGNPALGSFICSCFVHEINVDYCSSQSLPNCRGWATYKVAPPAAAGGAPIALQQAFPLWFDDAMARWDAVTEAFAAAAARAVAGGDASSSSSSLGPHQLFDTVQYPNNPTCVYPPG